MNRRPKRVLMLLQNNPYPQDIRVRREAETLAAAGYRVTVLAQRKSDQPWADTVERVTVYRFPAPPEGNGIVGYFLEYGYSMAALLGYSLFAWLRRGVDVVHLHNPPDMLILIAWLFKSAGKRIVFDHHDLAPAMYQALFDDGSDVLYKLLIFFESLSCRMADHIIVTNRSYSRHDVEMHGVAPENITVVRNGPDPARLAPSKEINTKKLNGKITICYVGDMGQHDGLDYLLHALGHLRFQMGRQDFHCVLVGSGSAWDDLQALSRELVIEDHLTFTGWVAHEQVRGQMEAADICVAPEPSNSYNNRSTMIKIMEYMAMARPIVAFDLPEHRVSAQGAARYARANDVVDFANQIAQLMDDPDRRRKLGEIGRRRVEEELAWSYQAEKLKQAYSNLWVKREKEEQLS